jgi:hypothetical protein
MSENTISMSQVKNLINYTIDNNLKLAEEGKTPIAVGIEAAAGIGKTSILEQIAKERNMGFAKISLHEMEEAGDLIGFPLTEYECQILQRQTNEKGEQKITVLPKTVWINAKQLEEGPGANMKFRQTGKTRMAYAKPAWVPEYNDNGTLVVLDDYVRANPQLLQACMELILTQKYTSWSLPKKTTICLTNNPDDGTNNVNSLDEAQRTRFLNFELTYDLNSWMTWAEKNNIDGRCINFVASYSNELFEADDEGNRICNPRSFVMFANMISGLKDWDNADTLSFINTIARGCFKDNGRFSQMFTAFLRNKMHLLIQPKKMLLGDWSEVKGILDQTLYDQSTGQYRPDIASLLERRFVSFVDAWLESPDKTPIEKVKKRIIDFLDVDQNGGRRFFTKDQFYHMIKTITSEHRRQTSQLLYEPKIAKIIS